ncbi:MAG TPA: SRPBCC family protein, partial [Thermodesulfovibrionales bacterium]|nr:SRPBCC family protein [Thermodesulfovibrionales bacterium]
MMMILKNRIEIAVPPKKLWGLISDPLRIMSWNPKVRTVIPVTIGEPKAGSHYRIRYHLIAGESNYAAELMEFEEPVRCVLHLKGGNLPAQGYIQEIYEIADTRQGCRLTQTILIDQAGLFFLRALHVRLRHLLGPGSARRYLRKLKGLAESSETDPA